MNEREFKALLESIAENKCGEILRITSNLSVEQLQALVEPLKKNTSLKNIFFKQDKPLAAEHQKMREEIQGIISRIRILGILKSNHPYRSIFMDDKGQFSIKMVSDFKTLPKEYHKECLEIIQKEAGIQDLQTVNDFSVFSNKEAFLDLAICYQSGFLGFQKSFTLVERILKYILEKEKESTNIKRLALGILADLYIQHSTEREFTSEHRISELTYVKGFAFARQSNEAGLTVADWMLADCYFYNIGLPVKDISYRLELAKFYYEKAIANGFTNANPGLKRTLEQLKEKAKVNSLPDPKEFAAKIAGKKGNDFLKELKDLAQTHKAAANYCGVFICSGHAIKGPHVTRDYLINIATSWFKTSANAGFPVAFYNLALCYAFQAKQPGIDKESIEYLLELSKFYLTQAEKHNFREVAKAWELCGNPNPIVNWLLPLPFFLPRIETIENIPTLWKKIEKTDAEIKLQQEIVETKHLILLELKKKLKAELIAFGEDVKESSEKKQKVDIEKIETKTELDGQVPPIVPALTFSPRLETKPLSKIVLDTGDYFHEFTELPDEATLEELELDEMIVPLSPKKSAMEI